MRFNRFLHLIAFAGKAHRGSPASGGLTTKMPDGGAPSQAMSQPDFSPYLPLSATLPPSVDQIYFVLGDPEDYKPNTRRQRYAVLHALFNSGTYLALSLPDPLNGVPRPAKERTRKRKFNDAEIAALLKTGDDQDEAFVKLGLDAGPRVG